MSRFQSLSSSVWTWDHWLWFIKPTNGASCKKQTIKNLRKPGAQFVYLTVETWWCVNYRELVSWRGRWTTCWSADGQMLLKQTLGFLSIFQDELQASSCCWCSYSQFLFSHCSLQWLIFNYHSEYVNSSFCLDTLNQAFFWLRHGLWCYSGFNISIWTCKQCVQIMCLSWGF